MKNNKTFHLTLSDPASFRKGDAIRFANDRTTVKVIKTYHPSRLKNILQKLGFKVRINQIKCKYV